MASSGGFIIGGIQIIAGVLLSVFSVGTLSQIGVSLIISGVTTIGAAALAPRPLGGEGGFGTSAKYGFDSISNAAFEGAPRFAVVGEEEIAPTLIASMTEMDGDDQILKALYFCGTGGANGIESISGIYLNDQPIEHFEGVTVTTRLGTSSQAVIDGFEKVGVSHDVGVKLAKGEAYTYTTHEAVDEVALAIAWNSLYRAKDNGYGHAHWGCTVEYQNEDDKLGRWVKYGSPVGVTDGWGRTPNSSDWRTWAKSTSIMRRIIRLKFTSKKVRTIRITAAHETSETYSRDGYLQRVEELVYDSRAYAGSALLAIEAVASSALSGGLPRVSCIVKGWKITQMNGQTAWTNNPAEILRAVLLDEDDGAGHWIKDADLDDTMSASTFWTARQHYLTDAENISSSPHDHPRHELDLVIDSMQPATEWLTHILTLCRSQLIEYEGQLHLLVDKAASSDRTFDGRQARDTANRPILRNEDGTPDFSEQKVEKVTHLKAQYFDETDRYARRWTEELVDPDWSAGDEIVRHELYMPGVTREMEAVRQCRYAIQDARLRNRVIDFGVGPGDLDMAPFDVFTLYLDSPAYDGVLFQVLTTVLESNTSGRIVARKYDASVYTDTIDPKQVKANSLKKARLLKSATAVPAGASNVKVEEVKGSTNLRVSWDARGDAARDQWYIYLSKSKDLKGDRVGASDSNRHVKTIRYVDEGTYWIRVLALSHAGVEEGWRKSKGSTRYLVDRLQEKPSAGVNVGGGNNNGAGMRVLLDPPPRGDPPVKVEVIKGPDEYTGQLLESYPVEREGTTGDGGQRTVSPIISCQPGRRTGDDAIQVRVVAEEGKRGGEATEITVPFLDPENSHAIDICSIVGTTLVNISAPASTAPWETDATDGARLKEIPAPDNLLEAEWGVPNSGLLDDVLFGSRYLPEGVITSDEVDLGAAKTFTLECYDEAQRDSAAGALANTNMGDIPCPWSPVDDDEISVLDLGPGWLFRHVRADGKLYRPLDRTLWEYRVGTSPSLSGDWLVWTPGLRISGRYVDVRATLKDPIGWHQVICPRLYVRAWVESLAVATKSGGYSMDADDDVILVSATAIITLPDAATVARPKRVSITNVGTGTTTTVNSAGGTVHGAATQELAYLESLTIVPDGTDWWVA